MKARSRRGGFEVTAIAIPHAFAFKGAQQPAGSVIVQGPNGGRRVYSPEEFDRLYEVTAPDAPRELAGELDGLRGDGERK
jgi:hypothetical protein